MSKMASRLIAIGLAVIAAGVPMPKPTPARVLTLVVMLVLSSAQVGATEFRYPPAGLPLTPGASLPTSIPATLSLPRRAVGSVPAVVIGSSEGAEDKGPDGARQIRRRLRQVLETRR